jgi:hypothetical protein
MQDLVTLEEFKQYKKINSTEYDDRLDLIIKSVSAYVKSYCNRTFNDYSSQDKTEYLNGRDKEFVYLQEFPILTLTSVHTSIDGGVSYTELIEDTDVFLDYDTGQLIEANGLPFVSLGTGHKSLKVVYSGGFVELPEDLKLACLDLVDYYRDNGFVPKKQVGPNVTENSGFRQTSSTSLPAHIKRVLDIYRVFTV